jgi:hypothetical protein
MIANFFQSLDRNRVEYLLISGQATVLYGAATFSEDIDLWVKPTKANRDQFVVALCECQAYYYKLTPPLTVEHLHEGHGFHFLLPAGNTKTNEIYLDVMGNPPRVDSFEEASATSRWMETEWGIIRTIGIKPLVEIKKTQRLEDYPIVSKLALRWFDQPECRRSVEDFVWAVQNIYTLPELTAFFMTHPDAAEVVSSSFNTEIAEFGQQVQADGEASESVERRVGKLFQSHISDLQLADRQYWRNIIRRLKELRITGQLMAEGIKVSASD